jgi:hypothetical protein
MTVIIHKFKTWPGLAFYVLLNSWTLLLPKDHALHWRWSQLFGSLKDHYMRGE